jgi:hypothetical protein
VMLFGHLTYSLAFKESFCHCKLTQVDAPYFTTHLITATSLGLDLVGVLTKYLEGIAVGAH